MQTRDKPDIDQILKDTILSRIGNTPLVRFINITKHLPMNIQIWAKMENQNPGGSIKDRPALQMVLDGIDSGELTHDKVILDSTSGNTGIALAMIGSVLGYRVDLCVPENISSERKIRLITHGANIIYTSQMEGSDGAIIEAHKLYEANPDKYFKPDQYGNPSNPKAHRLTTGPEIWRQTDQKVTHFVATLGTTGTIMGTGQFLKEKNSSMQVIAAEPDNAFHGLEGLKHMESSIVPPIFKPERLDQTIPIPTEPSYEMSRRLCREEGHFVGQSAGGAVWASLQLAERLVDEGVKEALIVAILCDGGDRYYSKGLWEVHPNSST